MRGCLRTMLALSKNMSPRQLPPYRSCKCLLCHMFPFAMVTVSRVAFQGELGAFSEQGVAQLWPDAEPVPMRDFIDVARAVENGEVELGLLPIENTLAGSVIGSYDALFTCGALHVVGETVVAIHHCVLALPGATLESLRTVASHPVALAQCARFFRSHPHLAAHATYDTAGAAREVAAR